MRVRPMSSSGNFVCKVSFFSMVRLLNPVCSDPCLSIALNTSMTTLVIVQSLPPLPFLCTPATVQELCPSVNPSAETDSSWQSLRWT